LLGEHWELLHINAAWVAFGLENGGLRRNSEAVIGQRYVNGASDPATRALLETIHAHTTSGEAFTLCSNCNGPGVERRLASHFLPVPRGHFRGTAVIHSMLSEVRAGEAPQGELGLRGAELCTCCNRVRRPGERRWRHVTCTSKEPLLLASAVCPTCAGLRRWVALA
jgi:hypothetical protein